MNKYLITTLLLAVNLTHALVFEEGVFLVPPPPLSSDDERWTVLEGRYARINFDRKNATDPDGSLVEFIERFTSGKWSDFVSLYRGNDAQHADRDLDMKRYAELLTESESVYLYGVIDFKGTSILVGCMKLEGYCMPILHEVAIEEGGIELVYNVDNNGELKCPKELSAIVFGAQWAEVGIPFLPVKKGKVESGDYIGYVEVKADLASAKWAMEPQKYDTTFKGESDFTILSGSGYEVYSERRESKGDGYKEERIFGKNKFIYTESTLNRVEDFQGLLRSYYTLEDGRLIRFRFE